MGLRDRLRERQLPQATVGIRIDWSAESYELHHALEREERLLFLAESGGDADIEEIRVRVAEIRAQVDAMYEPVVVRAIPAAEFEDLVASHPATKEQADRDPLTTYNRDTFFPALLAACIEGPESEQDWSEMINSGELVMGEVNTLISTAMDLNDRSPSVSLGKGSTTTSS